MAVAVHDVFPESAPTHTLIDRSHRVERIQHDLKVGGRIIRLHGPSKIGKTLLCLQVLKDQDPVIIYGDRIDTREQFWALVAQRVGVNQNVIQEYCARQRRPIVIEDFHWVEKGVRAALIRSFKELIENRGTVVLVSVPDVAQEFLEQSREATKQNEILGDMLARSVPVPAPVWEEDEIREIAVRGFRNTLRVTLPEWTISVLTRFAFRNPLLMQKHCAELCFVLKIKQSNNRDTAYQPTRDQLISVFQKVAKDTGRLFDGIISKDTRRKYQLNTGKMVNLTELLLFAIATMSIAVKLGMPRLLRRIRASLKAGQQMPTTDEIKKAITSLISDMRRAGQSGLVTDSSGFLYLAHPFFKAYLVWKHVPQCGGALPDLDRYIDLEEASDNGAEV